MFRKCIPGTALVFAAVLVSCGTDVKSPALTNSASESGGLNSGSGGADMCPAAMKEATITLADTPEGIAVSLVAGKADQVEPLRSMVRHMAGMMNGDMAGGDHGPGMDCSMGTGMSGGMDGGMNGGMHGGGGMGMGQGGSDGHEGHHGGGGGSGDADCCGAGMMGPGGMMSGLPPTTVVSEEMEGGARLTFEPRDPARLAELRAALRSHFDSMQAGGCPMMRQP